MIPWYGVLPLLCGPRNAMTPPSPSRRRCAMRHGGWLLFLLTLAAGTPGCAAFERTRPVPVLIRDAETKQPIAGAAVAISYPLAKGPATPAKSSGVTADDGIAHLHAVPAVEAGIGLAASAQGYLSEWKDLPPDELRRLEPAHLFEAVEK